MSDRVAGQPAQWMPRVSSSSSGRCRRRRRGRRRGGGSAPGGGSLGRPCRRSASASVRHRVAQATCCKGGCRNEALRKAHAATPRRWPESGSAEPDSRRVRPRVAIPSDGPSPISDQCCVAKWVNVGYCVARIDPRAGEVRLLPPRLPGPTFFQRPHATRRKGSTQLAFRGQYEHSLDAKDRITVPARFRAALAEGVVLAQGLEPCVEVYSECAYAGRRGALPRRPQPVRPRGPAHAAPLPRPLRGREARLGRAA